MMGSNETDSTKWNCNNLNSMFGNCWNLGKKEGYPLTEQSAYGFDKSVE